MRSRKMNRQRYYFQPNLAGKDAFQIISNIENKCENQKTVDGNKLLNDIYWLQLKILIQGIQQKAFCIRNFSNAKLTCYKYLRVILVLNYINVFIFFKTNSGKKVCQKERQQQR